MKWNSTITAIGSEALDPEDNIVILFDNKATDKLRDVAALQEFDPATPVEKFVFKKDDSITIDGTTYLALYVGPMVQMNMRAIGHATLVFTNEVPKRPMTNAIYLEKDSKEKMPEFKVGDWITYEHR